MRRNRNCRGFTLIEVLVTLGLMAIAFLGFHQGQAGSVKMAVRAEMRSQAYALAQKQMTEIELQLRTKGFQGFLEEESGSFKEEEFKPFRWTRKLEKVEIGCFIPAPATEGPEAGFYQIAQKIFTEAIRKIRVTVLWEENKRAQKISLTQLYVRWEDIPPVP
jgi:prepilin-type N-terminal cleavage/methylation domain-containing protein